MATNDTTRAAAPAADSTATSPAAAPAARRAPAARAARRAPRARARRAPRARRAARRAPRTRVGTTSEPVAVTPIAQAQQLAERIVLIPVGAALEARDRVAGALEGVVSASTEAIEDLRAATSSRRALDRQLKRFERRGGKARTELERDLRRTRTRLEREVRHSRTRAERRATEARRGFEHQRAEARRALGSNVETLQRSVAPVRQRVAPLTDRVAPLTGRVAPVRNRVESVVQNGLGAGRRFVEDAQDRIAKVA